MKNEGAVLEIVLAAVTCLLILKIMISCGLNRRRRRSSLYQLVLDQTGSRPGPPRIGVSSTRRSLRMINPFGGDRREHVQARRSRGNSRSRDARRLISEAEAYLDGSYVDRALSNDCESCLAVVNHLAHADRDRLEEWERARQRWNAHLQAPWGDAAAFLASEVLRCCGTAAELRRVQRSALVPLELDLLRYRGPLPGPEALARVALARLQRQQRHPPDAPADALPLSREKGDRTGTGG
jgi:hypothetical protein